MSRVLIVPADSHVAPRLMRDAVAEAAQRSSRVWVLAPAVLPPTLPISALPPRIAARVTALAEAARTAMAALDVHGRVAIAPCRSVATLLRSAGYTDALILVAGPAGTCAAPPMG